MIENMDDREGETHRLKRMDDNSPQSASPGDDSYDPHVHRIVDKPTTNFETLVHLLKSSLGTGILAMPQAFARSGLITGIVATFVIGVMVTHCLHILVRSQYVLCKKQRVALLTYPESMVAALEMGPKATRGFARASASMIDIFLVVYQLGICCVYIVFIAESVKKLVDPYFTLSLVVWMIIVLVPLIGANLIRNLKDLAPLSTLANVLIFLGLIVIVYFLFSTPKKTDDSIDLWGSISTFPLYFGTTLFALTAVGVVIALENNMKNPKDFGKPFGVLNVGMAIIVVLYIGLGVIGYLFCLSDCKDSISLELSLAWQSITVQICYTIAILISYALQCYPPVEILWKTYWKPRLQKKGVTSFVKYEYILRIFLCILTFLVALAVPRLGLFISLFGALCLSALGIIFPAFMEICVSSSYGPFKIKLIKDTVLIVVGIVGMIVGSATAIIAIIQSFT